MQGNESVLKIVTPDFITQRVSNLASLKVTVVGAGGTGSQVLAKLFQLNNIAHALTGEYFQVEVYDPDTVSAANIGRQAFYPFDIGKNKAEVLVNRFAAFSNQPWEAHPETFDPKIDSYSHYTKRVIFGCVDTVSARKTIHTAFADADDCIWIDCGNDANSANVIMGINARTENQRTYLPTVYDLYKQQMDTDPDTNVESCSAEDAINKQDFGINDMAAAYAVQMFWQLLRHGQCNYQGVQINLSTGETHSIKPDPDLWAMYGWEPSVH
tara:strand:- start:9506 stop:10312 length:807 start_codon:yes stop_codon:yes gene_type:complete